MKRFAVAVAAIVVLGLASAALGSGALSGKYKTTIKGSTLFQGFFNGTWMVNFKNGTYHVTKNGQAVVHGVNTFSGNVITFKDKPGPSACKTKGTYKYTLKGKKLTFKLVKDSKSGNCAGRRVVLVGHTFTKT